MIEATDYRVIFDGVESALIRVGNQGCRKADIRHELDDFKTFSERTLTDTDYFRIMVHVAFYAGFKAVGERLAVINSWFDDYQRVADYGPAEMAKILSDSGMIHHEGKISGCIQNAKEFRTIVKNHGSFQKYVDKFSPRGSLENLMKLRKDLRRRFAYLGKLRRTIFSPTSVCQY